jgi:hypothetical protein
VRKKSEGIGDEASVALRVVRDLKDDVISDENNICLNDMVTYSNRICITRLLCM